MSSSEIENKRCPTPEYKKKIRGESSCKAKHRSQKYRHAWQQDKRFKGWVIEGKDSSQARCRACNVDIKAEITVLKNHSKSAKHLLKVKQIPNITISEFINNQESSLETQKKIAEIKLTAFLVEHNISFRCADHLSKVVKECFPDSKITKEITLGRTKATQITKNVIGACASEDLVFQLKSNKFSIIIDESTDISSVKTLCLCVRLFSEKEAKITTYFWKLIQVFSGEKSDQANQGATADRLFTEIIDTCKKHGVPMKNIIGFASDGCNTMFGKYNSVAAKLESSLPGITLLKCICHSLHLCASEACKCLPRRCEDLARNIHNFFKNSAKRQAMYREFQDFCNSDPHKLLRPAQTRWLSLLDVVNRILEQWEPLRLFFTSNYLEHRIISSEEIYLILNNQAIKLFYIFLRWVLPKFVDLNKHFQSEKVVILGLHEKMTVTYKELLSAYMEPNYINRANINEIDPANSSKFLPNNRMYLGIGVLQTIQTLNDNEKEDFFERSRRFLMTACNEIKKRYNFEDPVLSNLSMLRKDNIKKYDSLYPLMHAVPRICDPNDYLTLQKIDDQWRVLKHFEKLPEKDDIDSFYFELGKYRDFNNELIFPDLARFALNLLSLPHSSASCERIFSKVNTIKTKSRNKLLTNTLNGLLSANQYVIHSNNCYEVQPTSKMFNNMTSVRLYRQDAEIEEDDDVQFLDEI